MRGADSRNGCQSLRSKTQTARPLLGSVTGVAWRKQPSSSSMTSPEAWRVELAISKRSFAVSGQNSETRRPLRPCGVKPNKAESLLLASKTLPLWSISMKPVGRLSRIWAILSRSPSEFWRSGVRAGGSGKISSELGRLKARPQRSGRLGHPGSVIKEA